MNHCGHVLLNWEDFGYNLYIVFLSLAYRIFCIFSPFQQIFFQNQQITTHLQKANVSTKRIQKSVVKYKKSWHGLIWSWAWGKWWQTWNIWRCFFLFIIVMYGCRWWHQNGLYRCILWNAAWRWGSNGSVFSEFDWRAVCQCNHDHPVYELDYSKHVRNKPRSTFTIRYLIGHAKVHYFIPYRPFIYLYHLCTLSNNHRE